MKRWNEEHKEAWSKSGVLISRLFSRTVSLATSRCSMWDASQMEISLNPVALEE